MKLACDVKGTLTGSKQDQVLKILDLFYNAGYEITIWSNLYTYAIDALGDFNLKDRVNADATSKSSKGDYGFEYDENKYFDFAIEDDRSQTYLATKKFIFVDEIPEMDKIDEFVKKLLLEEK